MPHCPPNMADHHRESARVFYGKGRKTMAARKGNSRQSPGIALQSCSSGRSTTPPGAGGGEMNRHRLSPQTLSSSWPAKTEFGLHFVGSYRCPDDEHQDGVLGQSPPKSSALRPAAGTQFAPSPALLPRPPSSWTSAGVKEVTPPLIFCSDVPEQNSGSVLANQLKMLLKVQG